MVNISKGHVTAFVCLAGGFVFCTIAFAAPYWFGMSVAKTRVHFGLWKECSSSSYSESEICITLDSDYESWPIKTPQALECLNLALSIVCLACSGLLFKPPLTVPRFYIAVATGAGAILAGVFGAAGAASFVNKLDDLGVLTLFDKEWCFYLNVIGDVFLLLSGILHLVYGMITRSRGEYLVMG